LGSTYSYTDTAPVNGMWWYWLADVDTRGKESSAVQTTASVNVSAETRYRVYLPLVFKETP